MTAYPFTPADAESLKQERNNPVQFNPVKDFSQGFADENLPSIAFEHMVNHQDFIPDET